jgi:hypothetical protein
MHSFSFRTLCLLTYIFEGEMRFYCVSDEKCMTAAQMDTLQREFLALLAKHAAAAEGETSRIPAAVAG